MSTNIPKDGVANPNALPDLPGIKCDRCPKVFAPKGALAMFPEHIRGLCSQVGWVFVDGEDFCPECFRTAYRQERVPTVE